VLDEPLPVSGETAAGLDAPPKLWKVFESPAFSQLHLPSGQTTSTGVFTSQQTFNPYVNGQTVFLPGKLNTSPLRNTIEAGLSQTGSFNGAVAWVFDTDKSAASALKVVPLSTWLSGDPPIVRVHDGNVIIVASGFKGAEAKKLQTALAAIKS